MFIHEIQQNNVLALLNSEYMRNTNGATCTHVLSSSCCAGQVAAVLLLFVDIPMHPAVLSGCCSAAAPSTGHPNTARTEHPAPSTGATIVLIMKIAET